MEGRGRKLDKKDEKYGLGGFKSEDDNYCERRDVVP